VYQINSDRASLNCPKCAPALLRYVPWCCAENKSFDENVPHIDRASSLRPPIQFYNKAIRTLKKEWKPFRGSERPIFTRLILIDFGIGVFFDATERSAIQLPRSRFARFLDTANFTAFTCNGHLVLPHSNPKKEIKR
jgi:hypothetical protein